MPKATRPPYLDNVEEGVSPTTSHPAYVAAAPDFFWDESDPRAPFSSDDGHDTLATLQDHFANGGADDHVAGCIANLIVEWGVVPEAMWESQAPEITAWLDEDDVHVRFLHGEIDAFIAAACGHFKISGWIDPAVRFWAERALMLLEHVLDPWEREKFGGDAAEYAAKLAATRAVVAAAPDAAPK